MNVYPQNDYRNYLAHHGIKNQKWGVRRFQNADGSLTPAGKERYKRGSLDDYALRIHQEAVKNEPKITNDVIEAADNSGSSVYGLQNRLKTLESIDRKVRLGKQINDAVRYTTISSDNDFVKNYKNFKRQLESRGYVEIKCKNYFEDYRLGKVKHKSVQCNFESKDGYTFEVQFHTKASQSAKNKKIPLYEEVRKPDIDNKRKSEIIDQMERLAEEVPDPRNINKIKSHSIAKDVAKGAITGAANKAVDAAVKTILGKPIDAVSEITEAAITGAIKEGTKGLIKKGGKK